jgi:hypothetical protein
MEVIHVSADLVRMFLLHREESRGLRHFDTEPAPGGPPLAGPFRGPAQPRAHRLV